MQLATPLLIIFMLVKAAQALIAGLGLSSDRLTFTHSSPSRLLAASISSVATCLKCSICALYYSKKHIILKQYPNAPAVWHLAVTEAAQQHLLCACATLWTANLREERYAMTRGMRTTAAGSTWGP